MDRQNSIQPHASLRVAYFAGTMRPGHDGVTRVLYRLIESLNKRRIGNLFFSPIVPQASEQPTMMVEVPSVQFPLYKDYRFAVPGQGHFEQRLGEFKPHIIHINSPCSLGYAAVRYGEKHNIPVVATYHTHFPSYARYYKMKALESFAWSYLKRLYNSCERIYVPSEPILHELEGHGLKNLLFLPHGVDTTAFHPHYRSQLWKERNGIGRRHAVLYVGRLVWEKDLRTLAEAYRLLRTRREDAVVVLVGDGPIRSELERAMPGALFLGYQTGIDLATAYASSDVFVFPSTTETFGNVTAEAMASGIVPICAMEGGASGIIRKGVTGLLVRPRDSADLVEKIEYLLDHSGRRNEMADQALQSARRQTWEHVFDLLFSDYEEVLRDFRVDPARRRRTAA